MTDDSTHATGRRLQGRVALITGASRGMGAAAARRFVAEGAAVALAHEPSDRMAALTRDLAAELGGGRRPNLRPGRRPWRPDRTGEAGRTGPRALGALGHPGRECRRSTSRGDRGDIGRGLGRASGGERPRDVPARPGRGARPHRIRPRVDHHADLGDGRGRVSAAGDELRHIQGRDPVDDPRVGARARPAGGAGERDHAGGDPHRGGGRELGRRTDRRRVPPTAVAEAPRGGRRSGRRVRVPGQRRLGLHHRARCCASTAVGCSADPAGRGASVPRHEVLAARAGRRPWWVDRLAGSGDR